MTLQIVDQIELALSYVRNRKLVCANKSLLWCAALFGVLMFGGGCNLVMPVIYWSEAEKTRKIEAEYDDFSGKKVCIWVWADESLLFVYPAVRLDVANHARYCILEHLEDVDFVDPAKVMKFQRSNYEADSMPVIEVGRKFEADVVLFIQVVDFTTRPVNSPNLYQGQMITRCSLYDCSGELPVGSSKRKLWSGKVEVKFPEHPVGMLDTNDRAMRSILLRLFGDELAKKFYDYKVKVGDMKREDR